MKSFRDVREATHPWRKKSPEDLEKIRKALAKEKSQAGKLRASGSTSTTNDKKYFDHLARNVP
jgi:hypothetical protein